MLQLSVQFIGFIKLHFAVDVLWEVTFTVGLKKHMPCVFIEEESKGQFSCVKSGLKCPDEFYVNVVT